VPCVYLDFGSESQRPLDCVTPNELAGWLDAGQFEEGTMAPKVEAARRFGATGGRTIICDAESIGQALVGRAGTIVMSEP